MAEQVFVELFRSVDGRIHNLTTTMGAQSVAKIVQNFDGSKPKEFKNWVKSIEKFATLTNIPVERTKFIAYQASKGPVSDFLKRYLDQHADHNWGQIKAELKGRFGEVVDSQYALLLLRKVKQTPSETVQVYAERLLAIGEDAFDGQDQGAVQRQLVGYFIDGLFLDSLKLKVMRENPDNFHAAVNIATREQNLRKRFQLRTGYSVAEQSSAAGIEPMEIGHMRNKDRCHFCHKKGHHVKDCRLRKKDRQVNATGTSQSARPNDVICYHCKKPGHFARNCRGKQIMNTRQNLNVNSSHM